MDADILKSLKSDFGKFDAVDSGQSFQEKIVLCEKMSRELPVYYHHSYPEALVSEVKHCPVELLGLDGSAFHLSCIGLSAKFSDVNCLSFTSARSLGRVAQVVG